MGFLKKTALIMFAMALVIGSGLSAAAPPDHANGKAPEKFYWVDEFGGPTTVTVPFIDCGDFSTLLTITLQGFWIVHPDRPGKEQFEFYHSAYATAIANADDESKYVEGIPGQVINRHWSGEAFASDPIETGVQLMVTLPGHGVIYRDVGRLRLDWDTFEPEFLAGHWDSFDADYQALCAALAP